MVPVVTVLYTQVVMGDFIAFGIQLGARLYCIVQNLIEKCFEAKEVSMFNAFFWAFVQIGYFDRRGF